MRRLSLWLRSHPVVGDAMIALLLAVLSYGQFFVELPRLTPLPLKIVAFVLLLGPVVVRRLYPMPAAYLVLLGGAVQLFAFTFESTWQLSPGVINGADIALGVMLYTLVVYTTRRVTVVYALLLAVGTALWAVWRIGDDGGFFKAMLATLTLAFCWILGAFVGARHAYHAGVEERLRLLETERDQQARIAVVEERARIARELHDVVAHAVSVIVVQADGAAYAIRDHPELAEKALHTISATGREALSELRRLLGVLREDDRDGQSSENRGPDDRGPEDRSPQPDAGSLRSLAEKVQLAGLPVRLNCAGDLEHLPTGVSLGIYRIVQESLTNTLKHAGPGARAAVTVNRLADRVSLEVVDSGMHVGTSTDRSPMLVSGGNGLIGMRERAGVYGGTLEAGPHPNGGWRVHAELPVSTEAP
ncbi:MAG: sensor histidine kinase [Sciscionella sp.]